MILWLFYYIRTQAFFFFAFLGVSFSFESRRHSRINCSNDSFTLTISFADVVKTGILNFAKYSMHAWISTSICSGGRSCVKQRYTLVGTHHERNLLCPLELGNLFAKLLDFHESRLVAKTKYKQKPFTFFEVLVTQGLIFMLPCRVYNVSCTCTAVYFDIFPIVFFWDKQPLPIVGSYSPVNSFFKNRTVRQDFPTPPDPTITFQLNIITSSCISSNGSILDIASPKKNEATNHNNRHQTNKSYLPIIRWWFGDIEFGVQFIFQPC